MKSLKTNPNVIVGKTSKFFLCLSACFLFGCAPTVPLQQTSSASTPERQLSFIDIGKFDSDLAASLSSNLPDVDVLFYSKVSPNNIPERLQKWISAAENSGGKVKVEYPSNEPTTRALPPLFSLLGTAYSLLKDKIHPQSDPNLNAAKGKNILIKLERSPSGDLLVEKIQFKN